MTPIILRSPADELVIELHPVSERPPEPPAAASLVLGRRAPSATTRQALRALFPFDPVRALADGDRAERAGYRLQRVTGDPGAFARAGAELGRLNGTGDTDISIGPLGRHRLARLVTAAVVATQRGAPQGTTRVLRLRLTDPDQQAVAHRAARIGMAVLHARRLANTPSRVKTPRWLSDQAATPGVEVTRRDLPWLRAHGFGGLIAVGGGSPNPPNLTVLARPGTGPHVVLVGKGITFDSGGLALKPATAMTLMKTDMSGAAAVIATMAALDALHVSARVTGVIACAENLPGGGAMRPGDVVRHCGGRTTEVRNTDAEGRLVVADALAYAAGQLRPDLLIDLATLTGAATAGLSRHVAALYSQDDELAAQLARAGDRSGDRAWRMPLVPQYRAAIGSDIADAANSATDRTFGAGSITAALFLQPFAEGTRWAHLDIAGPGRTESERPDCRPGATGYGVALLLEWLTALAVRA